MMADHDKKCGEFRGGGIALSAITSIVARRGAPQEYRVKQDGVDIPLFARFNGSEKLVVFFPGAHDQGQPKPKFQRRSYFDSLDCNCISLFDPTLFLHPDLMLGWFQGGGETYHVERTRDLILNILDVAGIMPENLILFATSAGGDTCHKNIGIHSRMHGICWESSD